MTKAPSTLDPLITSPSTFSERSASSAPPSLPQPKSTDSDSAVSELQTTRILTPSPATSPSPAKLTSSSDVTDSSTTEIPREKEEKYHLLDTEERAEEGEKDQTDTFSRIKRAAQKVLRFVFR